MVKKVILEICFPDEGRNTGFIYRTAIRTLRENGLEINILEESNKED